jgi:chemotaxis signal transduction protein
LSARTHSQGLKAVLDARATALAQAPTQERSEKAALVMFRRAGYLFGAHIAQIAGADRVREMTLVPGAPPALVGVVQWRGKVVSVVDLPMLWGETPHGALDLSTFVVMTEGTRWVGLLTEELVGFRQIDGEPLAYRGAPRVGLAQVARCGGETVQVLSAESLWQEGSPSAPR